MASKSLRLVVNDLPVHGETADGTAIDKAAPPEPRCGNCRGWERLGRQWGKCGSKRIQHFVETEGSLVTRETFKCRLHTAEAAVKHPRGRKGNAVSKDGHS